GEHALGEPGEERQRASGGEGVDAHHDQLVRVRRHGEQASCEQEAGACNERSKDHGVPPCFRLAHVPEKWIPVFRKGHAPTQEFGEVIQHHGVNMRGITLDEAKTMIEATFASARKRKAHPLSAIVLDAGGRVKAFLKQDGSSLMRFEIAYGKAFGALAL